MWQQIINYLSEEKGKSHRRRIREEKRREEKRREEKRRLKNCKVVHTAGTYF
jgi:hypothetical protein